MMIFMEPDERLERIRRARGRYDRARTEMFSEIREALTEAEALPDGLKRKLGPSAIARAANFTREYISKIRDGRTE